MKQRWASSFDISKGALWQVFRLALHTDTSVSPALPDNVFDEGERQPRSAQKRPKAKVRDEMPGGVPQLSRDVSEGRRKVEQYVTRHATQETTVCSYS